MDCFGAHGRVIVVLISRVAKEQWNKHQNKTRVSAAIARHESTYIILFLAQHNESIKHGKNDDFYTSSPCLARFSFCWWHRNRLMMTSQWPAICDAITRIVISNSLDVDFIHGDIHGRWCKNASFSFPQLDKNNPWLNLMRPFGPEWNVPSDVRKSLRQKIWKYSATMALKLTYILAAITVCHPCLLKAEMGYWLI